MINAVSEFDEEEQKILAGLTREDDAPAGDAPLVPAAGAPAPAAPAPAPAAPAAPAAAPAADAGAPAAAPAAAAPAPAAAPAAEAPPPQGDTRAALRASRRAERQARDELGRVTKELEDLKAGKGASQNILTEDEIRDMEENFPAQGKLARRQQELEREVAETRRAAAPAPAEDEFTPAALPPVFQDAIDNIPDLLEWQHDRDQTRWQAAVQMDGFVLALPGWRDKPLAERLAESARRVKAELAPATTPAPPAALAPAPAAARQDPAAVIAAAPVAGPQTLSDLRGGIAPSATSPDYSKMTDEQIIASLPPG